MPLWSLPRGLVPDGCPRRAPRPGFTVSFYLLSLCVCFFSDLFLWVCYPPASQRKFVHLQLRIVNSKNCILNFYTREEDPTSIYININISLYTYKYI